MIALSSSCITGEQLTGDVLRGYIDLFCHFFDGNRQKQRLDEGNRKRRGGQFASHDRRRHIDDPRHIITWRARAAGRADSVAANPKCIQLCIGRLGHHQRLPALAYLRRLERIKCRARERTDDWTAITDADRKSDLSGGFHTSNNDHLAFRMNSQMAGLRYFTRQRPHDRQRSLGKVTDRGSIHPQREQPISQDVSAAIGGKSNEAAMFEDLNHPEQFTRRSAEALDNCAYGQRLLLARKQFEDVEPLFKRRSAVKPIGIDPRFTRAVFNFRQNQISRLAIKCHRSAEMASVAREVERQW